MFRLPVSGLNVVLRQPAGADDILLWEAPGCDTSVALALIDRLARSADGTVSNWSKLAVTDLDALLLRVRQIVFGDLVSAQVVCSSKGCGARVEVSFGLDDYLAHHKPRAPNGLEPAEEAGWFRFPEEQIKFRLPSAGDLVAAAEHQKPECELIRRCIQPAKVPVRLRKRVEGAMEALAPSLSHDLQGECPECHITMGIYFDVQQYVLRELRDQAAFVYQDVHLLALHYKWSEDGILALPRNRRIHYAEMLRQEGSLA